jgi:ADP-ribosylglycohydrolase
MAELTLHDRVMGGILGLVVGDALGVPVEFLDREDVRKKPVTDMHGFGTHHQPPGTWSDDSSLALATLDSLRSGYDLHDMMDRFRRWRYTQYMTARGAVFDVGITTGMAIDAFRDAPEHRPWGGTGEGENGNGSLMRILPLSLYVHRWDPNIVIERSFEVSALTHAHLRSKLCCAYYSLLVKAILEGHNLSGAMSYAGKMLTPYVPEEEKRILRRILDGSVVEADEDSISSGGYVVHTLEASLWCCVKYHSFQSAVLAAVNLGGDTDTAGAVTGGLAGVLHGRQAISQRWIEALARSGDVQELADALTKKLDKMFAD